MRNLLILFLFLISGTSFSQVSGAIQNDKRGITKDIEYTMNSSKSGILVYTISVNSDGDVTHCELITSRSTIKSTPLMMKGKNSIVGSLKFEKGSGYPQFHQGEVTIKVFNSDMDPPAPPQ